MSQRNHLQGFTLIEVLLYIALLTLLFGGGVIAAYQVIEAANRTNAGVMVQEEGHFLLRKIDWALTGVTTIVSPAPPPASGPSLTVDKAGVGVITINLASGRAQLNRGVGFLPLTNDRVTIADLQFEHTDPDGAGGKPAAIRASFTINGNPFEITKYLR